MEDNKKYFFYGTTITGFLCFFACGGINSFLLTILLFLIINNNLFLLNMTNKYIHYICIILFYFILLLRSEFFNLSYFPFCFNCYMIIFKKNTYIFLISNIFFSFNFNYYYLLLLIINTLSFFFKKNFDINKSYSLIFFTLSALFIQMKGYYCLETLIIYIFLFVEFMYKTQKYVYIIIYIFYIIGYELLKELFFKNMIFNEKGFSISLLSYLFILI